MRRAKIVCTLGPATSDLKRISELIEAGMDVARFNMSHGDHSEHMRRLELVREASARAGRPVGVLADLQGPKIRLGVFDGNGKPYLSYGAPFTITTDDIVGNHLRCSTTHKGLPKDVKPGDAVLIDDGRVVLEAESVTDTDVHCRVKVAGEVSNHKGINLPGVAVGVPAMSEKDVRDLRWALQQGFDMVALSFVRDAADADQVRKVMDEEGRRVPVIAKVEKPQAVDAIEGVVHAFDAVMVARGDLGVELPLEQVPLAQKKIIECARRHARPVIVATQMLDSMIHAPRPTRAEASDVANAILDGADAVMLSGETSIGQYPVITVQTMARIVDNTELHGLGRIQDVGEPPQTIAGVLAKAAVDVAVGVEAKFLVAFTKSGDTARRLARLRSHIPILVFTPEERTRNALTLAWGIESFPIPEVGTTEEMVDLVNDGLINSGRAKFREPVVIVSGSPVGIPGKTNALRVHRIQPADFD